MSNEKKGKELKLDNFKITGDIIKWNGSVNILKDTQSLVKMQRRLR